jgi:heme-degrading monooxygenase HmoA
MSVLEILRLRVKHGISPTDPAILSSLITVRSNLRSKVTDTNSKFYQCVEDPSLIYVFGIWPSLEAHKAFLSSPSKSAILAPQDDLVDFNWMLHIPLSDMEDLPLDAPVLSIARMQPFGGGERLVEFTDVIEKYIRLATPWKRVDRWRVDCEEGKKELVLLSGWESIDSHESFTSGVRRDHSQYASAMGHLEKGEIKHARNMEG